ncbi:MAG TPA: DUF4294 domain-containing protein [Bacteroidia bacterium]|nr:DUF4294 domain-containing protein [Bacteroidia bacterium]
MKNAILILGLVLSGTFVQAQEDVLGVGDVNSYPKSVVSFTVDANGDTTFQITEFTCVVTADMPFANNKQKQAWDKLKRDVKKAYPYAVMAKMKLQEMDAQLALLTSESDRKDFEKKCQDELVAQFESDMRNMTSAQATILFKLMDRETSLTTYDIIKDYRGGLQAFMWQGVAVLFGNNLKYEYDPTGVDAPIEQVVNLIELGLI